MHIFIETFYMKRGSATFTGAYQQHGKIRFDFNCPTRRRAVKVPFLAEQLTFISTYEAMTV